MTNECSFYDALGRNENHSIPFAYEQVLLGSFGGYAREDTTVSLHHLKESAQLLYLGLHQLPDSLKRFCLVLRKLNVVCPQRF